MVTYMSFTKNAFSQSVFEHQVIVTSMREAWRHLCTDLKNFRSRDVINVIYRKAAITASFFKIKTLNKN